MRLKFLTASFADVVDAMERSNDVIVDIRPMAAYNGWPLRHEVRGGHIAGAVPFSVSWFSGPKSPERMNLLENKGITRDRNLILYGYGSDDASMAASCLDGLGFGRIRIYADGLQY